jgi:hypothetical protein
MSALDDTRSAVDAARSAIASAVHATNAALNVAYEKMQRAAALGLDGVAATLQAAHTSLEQAASSLNGAYSATDSAASTLATITDQTRRSDAIERVGIVSDQLDQATGVVSTSTASTHEAHNYSQQAEIDSLTATVGSLFDALGSAHQAVQDAEAKAAAYRQHVESLGNL